MQFSVDCCRWNSSSCYSINRSSDSWIEFRIILLTEPLSDLGSKSETCSCLLEVWPPNPPRPCVTFPCAPPVNHSIVLIWDQIRTYVDTHFVLSGVIMERQSATRQSWWSQPCSLSKVFRRSVHVMMWWCSVEAVEEQRRISEAALQLDENPACIFACIFVLH